MTDRQINDVIQRVAELPDRTSPDDWPDAMLVTADELREILQAPLPPSPDDETPRTLEVQPLDAAKLIAREGWFCTSCGHRHTGRTLANICIGCSCPETAPLGGTAEDDWIRIATQNAKDALAREQALRDEHARLTQELAQTTEAWAKAADDRDEANGLLRAAQQQGAALHEALRALTDEKNYGIDELFMNPGDVMTYVKTLLGAALDPNHLTSRQVGDSKGVEP